MIYLHFPKANAQIENWCERLDNLIVSYQTEHLPEMEKPVIIEGTKSFTGAEAIDHFLQELEKEVNDWRTPRCGV